MHHGPDNSRRQLKHRHTAGTTALTVLQSTLHRAITVIFGKYDTICLAQSLGSASFLNLATNMITRSSAGIRINKPARYRQSDSEPSAHPRHKPESKAKAKGRPKTKARAKAKAKVKAKAESGARVYGGRRASRARSRQSHPSVPPTFTHADVSAFPYDAVAGMEAHNSLASAGQEKQPSSGQIPQQREPCQERHSAAMTDLSDPIDDKFSDDESDRCSTGTRVVPVHDPMQSIPSYCNQHTAPSTGNMRTPAMPTTTTADHRH
ncbi:hypothetical protein FOZ62_022533, partial [Perkinsus olseni]